MKKLLGIITSAILVASCLGSAGYEMDYALYATFAYTDSDFVGVKSKPDSLIYDTDYRLGFTWEYVAFYHKVEEYSNEFRGGFLASCLKVPTSSDVSGLSYNEYRANAVNPSSNVDKYAVFVQTYDMPQKNLAFIPASSASNQSTCSLSSVYVTNSVAVEQAVRSSFVDGDKLVLKATGYLGTERTGSVEISLADYTPQKDSVITSWTKFDLSTLGSVDNVMFEISTPAGKYVPTTVCMDNLSAQIKLISK